LEYVELIYRTVTQAQRGGLNFEAINLDAQGMAEAQLPTVVQAVAENAAADPRKRSLLKQTVTVPFVNGTGTIPSYVLTKWIEDGTLYDSANPRTTYSWVRNFNDFVDAVRTGPYSAYGYYSIIGGDSLALTEPGVDYDPSSGFTGNRLLNAPTVPQIPTVDTDSFNAVDEILSDIIDAGSEMLRGQMSKAAGAGT
jgi:hypothetical protein